MFDLDAKGIRKLSDELNRTNKRALPYAVRNSLNTAAFEARKEWAQQVDKAMVLRNTFTQRSLRVVKANVGPLEHMHSAVGSVAPYMERQEFGGQESSKGKHGVPIPTTSAAGQSMKAKPRTRQVQRKNWQSAINLPGKIVGPRRQQNAAAISKAAKTGGVAFLNLGRKKGLFRVTGGKRRMRVRMIWDMSKRAIHIKPRPTLEPTLRIIEQKAPEYQQKALIEQFRRLKVYGF